MKSSVSAPVRRSKRFPKKNGPAVKTLQPDMNPFSNIVVRLKDAGRSTDDIMRELRGR